MLICARSLVLQRADSTMGSCPPKKKKNYLSKQRGGNGGVNLEIPSPLEVFHHKQGDGEHGVALWDPVTDLI